MKTPEGAVNQDSTGKSCPRFRFQEVRWMGKLNLLSCALGSMLMLLTLATGCSSTKPVAQSEGQGKKRVFHVAYDAAWAASRGAADLDNMLVIKEDKAAGFILAKRDIGLTTFGDDVAIWVRPLSARMTSIEVLSRRKGPPVWPPANMEKPIMKNIATMLDQ